ncbi:MAG: hypothetical protein LBT97_03735 [Planctomycetota bacterium]|jgi:hypothetical protein|nr:hypothetical protein [Planctomycetota bacterium]
MKTFTDAAGRTWTLALNLGTAMWVKAKLDIDLLQPEAGEPPLLTRLGTDEMLLGEVICALLDSQFETHKVTAEEVRAAFDGETLLAAQKAFYEELIGFFRSRGRNDRAKAVAKQMTLIDAAVTAMETRLDALDIDATIRGAMSGASPEPPTSTPGR